MDLIVILPVRGWMVTELRFQSYLAAERWLQWIGVPMSKDGARVRGTTKPYCPKAFPSL
jgi:hypothetical protein